MLRGPAAIQNRNALDFDPDFDFDFDFDFENDLIDLQPLPEGARLFGRAPANGGGMGQCPDRNFLGNP